MVEIGTINNRLIEVRTKLFGPRGRSRMARELGMHPNVYTNYEKDRMPPPNVLARVAEIAGVRLEWLVTGRGSKKKDIREELLKNIPVYNFQTAAGLASGSRSAGKIIAHTVNERNLPGENLFAVICTGTSMEPVIRNGCFLVLNPDRQPPFYGPMCYKIKRDPGVECKFLAHEDEDKYYFTSVNPVGHSAQVAKKHVDWIHPVVGVY